jgi:hypothetical protein
MPSPPGGPTCVSCSGRSPCARGSQTERYLSFRKGGNWQGSNKGFWRRGRPRAGGSLVGGAFSKRYAGRLPGVASQAAKRACCSAVASGHTSNCQRLGGSAPNVMERRCRRSRRATSTVTCSPGR